MFLATRWTNLFFTNNRLTKGDIVGGPVCPNFGRGVLDIPIERRILGDGFLHNEYPKWPDQDQRLGPGRRHPRLHAAALSHRPSAPGDEPVRDRRT
ncbi:hypothetical protein [Phenylobacterium sp.]|uniref:hypothetical protein n=1 Tax=Phenylobacterium sp. TaxID=1871053 RepID=UPI0027344629|nr:hypothetical protein [Phenylobacterium sp.]MDP3855433.1 hypothetical protein [Phenylobacterium sp.]